MSETEFWDAHPDVVISRINGFHTLENERQKQEWERTRWQTWLLLNIHIDRARKIKKPQELAQFPWERPEKIDNGPLSDEERRKRFARWDAQMKKRGKHRRS